MGSAAQHLHAYCDESGWNAKRHMALGGILVPASSRNAVRSAIASWRTDHRMHSELKWTSVSAKKLPEYKSLIDMFFDLCRTQGMSFKVAIFDKARLDYRKYHAGDKALGFDKFFYQLLLHKFACHCQSGDACLYVFLHRKHDRRTPLDEFMAILNAGVRKEYGLDVDAIRDVQHVGPEDSDVLQLTDVLLGGVRFHAAGDHLKPGASPAKVALAEHVAAHAGVPSLAAGTPPNWPYFDVWPFRARGEATATP